MHRRLSSGCHSLNSTRSFSPFFMAWFWMSTSSFPSTVVLVILSVLIPATLRNSPRVYSLATVDSIWIVPEVSCVCIGDMPEGPYCQGNGHARAECSCRSLLESQLADRSL